MFVDHGRKMPNGQPVLLNRREYLRRMLPSNAGKNFCGWAGQLLALLGALRLPYGSDLQWRSCPDQVLVSRQRLCQAKNI